MFFQILPNQGKLFKNAKKCRKWDVRLNTPLILQSLYVTDLD